MKIKINAKELNKISSKILNSKFTYLIIILLILVQFLLTSIIFLQNKKSKYLIEQTNFKISTVENKQNQIYEVLNSVQSNLMRMSAQLYRLNATSVNETK